LDEFGGGGGAGGLEAEENADGFEDGGLALGVLADDASARRAGVEIQGVEAAEVAQADFGDHLLSMRWTPVQSSAGGWDL
jgi:hypothetical protein